ncbi:MAG TPA: hypothetical protein VMJ33_07415 [Gallionella sp.]|nr:hypothetical protein [Gallionella sp.]
MSLNTVASGQNLLDDFNAITENPMRGEPERYETDKDSGAKVIDRFINTAMHRPCNGGCFPLETVRKTHS